MRIFNVRLGLATNSSSTHSIIFLPGGAQDSEVDDRGFGWQGFVCGSKQAKKDYLAETIRSNLSREHGDEIATIVAREWSQGGRAGAIEPGEFGGYVDHQSVITLPRDWDGKGLCQEFLTEFRDMLMRDDVVITGGNDNEDNSHPDEFYNAKNVLRGLPEEDYSPWVARKDPDGWWALFNRTTGAKLRIILDEKEGLQVKPSRSALPELVDIKITDYCPFGCDYCYQDSTKDGAHGEVAWLESLAWALGKMQCFEVALGGGEPTMHPEFDKIVDSFACSNVVVNFTTKNMPWVMKNANDVRLWKKFGAFAVSVETADDVKKLADGVKDTVCHEKATVQHVLGLEETPEQFQDLVEQCAESGLRVTLLGYKNVGRGPQFGERASAEWFKVLKRVAKSHYLRVGIDTVLADKYWDQLIEAGVPEWSMTRKEGQFSCYIDGVSHKVGPSSYCEPDKMAALPLSRGGYGDIEESIKRSYRAMTA